MLKKIGLVAFLLLLGGGGWFAYTWQQVTQLPDWYSSEQTGAPSEPSILLSSQVDDLSELDHLAFQLQQKVDRALIADPSGRQPTPLVKLTAQELNQFVVTALPSQALNPKVLAAVKAMRTEIKDSQVTTGVILDTAILPMEQLPPEYRLAVKGLLQSFPVLQDKEIYIGIEGQPRLQQGKVLLGENARLVIGKMRFAYADIRDRMQIPSTALDKSVTLQLGQLQIEDLDFQDRLVVLKGKVNSEDSPQNE